MKEKAAAVLSIDRPGTMTTRGRKDIVAWLRRQATHLARHGGQYCDKGWFRARYLYK